MAIGFLPPRRYHHFMVAISFLFVMVIGIHANRCFAFGDKGHKSIFRAAMNLLKVDPKSDSLKIGEMACTFPDHRIYSEYDARNLCVLSSIDHYFDPDGVTRCVDVNLASAAHMLFGDFLNVREIANIYVIDFDTLTSIYPLLDQLDETKKDFWTSPFINAVIIEDILRDIRQIINAGKCRTLDRKFDNYPGYWDDTAIDYNAITAMMRCLNRANGKDDLGICPPIGFFTKAGELSGKSGEERATILKSAWVQLGSALHYMQDLYSPGHTDWESVLDIRRKLVSEDFSYHTTFDREGDEFYQKYEISEYKENMKHKIVLNYDRNSIALDDSSGILREVAKESKGMWEKRPPFATGVLFDKIDIEELHKHYEDCIAATAGVIDWAFSSAANRDGPYKRDATNFLGIALDLLKNPDINTVAVIIPGNLSEKMLTGCSLGGIDQDDFFPIAQNTSQYIEVAFDARVEDSAVVKAYDEKGNPIGNSFLQPDKKTVKFDLGVGPVQKFILRVSSPEGKQVGYTISFASNDHVLKVNAVPTVVKQGSQIRFEGSVTDASGVPQPNVQIAVQDPIRQQSVAGEPSLKTNSDGKFSYAVSTQLTTSGVYSFMFWAADLPGQIVAVCVCEAAAAPGGHYLNIDVPLGSWGTLAEGYSPNPGLFVPTARRSTSRMPTTTGMIPPSSADEMVRRSKELGNANIDYWHRFANEFVGNPVNDIAVPAAIVSCPFPDVTVSKAVCAASLTYLAVSVPKTAFYAGMKQWIAESDRTAEEKQQAMVMVDAGNAIASAIMLDPETGFVGFPEASLGWNTLKTYLEFVDLPVGTGAAVGSSRALNLTVTFKDSPQVMNVTLIPITPTTTDQGMLDVVFLPYSCGSEGVEGVKEEFRTVQEALTKLGLEEGIDVHVGFVGFHSASPTNAPPSPAKAPPNPPNPPPDPTKTRPGQTGSFETQTLSSDAEPTRDEVNRLQVTDKLIEDLYSGMMYAMNQTVDGKSINMGWRQGAAKMLFPITNDEPIISKRFTFEQVTQVAQDLDPVHIYPLVFPTSSLAWLNPSVQNLTALANATGGEVIKVPDTKDLHINLLKAVKLSIRQHKEEVWRKSNPPYLLYGLGIAVAVIAVLGIAGLLSKTMRRPRWATEFAPDADPRLCGEPPAKARQRDERSAAAADPRLSGQTRHRRDPRRKG